MLNLPDIFLSITALINIGLVFFVYWRNERTSINTSFALLIFFLAFWAMIILQFRLIQEEEISLYLMKFSYICAILLAASFYYFSIVFPEGIRPSSWHRISIFSISAVISALLLVPNFLTKSIFYQSWGKEVVLSGRDYILFASIFLFLFVGGHLRIWWKYFHAKGPTRLQLLFLALSGSTAGLVGIYYNLILPSPFFEDFEYIWTGPIFTFFYTMVILYAIFRYRLFNIKAILAEVLTFSLWIFILTRTLLANSLSDQLLDVGLLMVTIIIGILLIRSVDREVEQRERIEQQEQGLEEANKRQENLIHFISHEIKGYLAKSEAAFAAIAEGDYGQVNEDLKGMVTMALKDTRKGVDTVMDILSASNFKKGTVTLSMQPFDLRQEVTHVFEEFKPAAEEKHLTLDLSIAGDVNYAVVGDAVQLGKHVLHNLIDNAIKYTPEGNVAVSLSGKRGKLLFAVKDSGVGITQEDKERLFTEGGRGKDSVKINTHSTGYGLFIAKSIVDKHYGRIWAESEGQGKGSTFYVELPSKDSVGGAIVPAPAESAAAKPGLSAGAVAR